MTQADGSALGHRFDEARLEPSRPPASRKDAISDARPHIALIKNSGWHIARHSAEQIKGLIEAGWRITAIADYTHGGQDVRGLGADTRNVFFEGSGTSVANNLVCVGQLALILRELRPNLVHCFGIKEIIHGGLAARLAGAPAVVHTVTGQGILVAEGHRTLKILLRRLARVAMAGAPSVIFQNKDDLAAFILSGLVKMGQARLIPGCGVDLAAFGEPPNRFAPTRFVMASRMLWSKGVREFVEAARIIKLPRPDAQFDLFGGCAEDYGSANPDFIPRAWLEALDVVRWHGRVAPEVVEQALQSADTAAAVLLSDYGEGVPRFLIEAAACSVPVITLDMPGCRDVVEHGGSGYVCDIRSPVIGQAAGHMLDLLSEPGLAQRMGARGREIAARFDHRRVLRDTLTVYEHAMQR